MLVCTPATIFHLGPPLHRLSLAYLTRYARGPADVRHARLAVQTQLKAEKSARYPLSPVFGENPPALQVVR